MRYHYDVNRGVTHLKTKVTLALMAFGLLFGSAALPLTLLGSANASPPPAPSAWSTAGSYVFDFEWQGGHYPHAATISNLNNSGGYTISGYYPTTGTHEQVWSGTGNVNGNLVTNVVTYTQGAVGTHWTMTGSIASDGTMSGAWADDYSGGRTGTWTTATGHATKFTKDGCMKGGWSNLGFSNQGQCVSYTERATKSAAAVYDATPSPLPPNVASLGYEATSTSEAGDYVHLAGTSRKLNTVTVTMSDWALYSQYSGDARYNSNSVNWTHPITVNIYSNHLDAHGVPDTRLATLTQAVSIPWRPAADSDCGTAWKATNGQCYNGVAFNATFDLSSQNVTLPNDVIVGVEYNTADYGKTPIGIAGPYNSLNVGIPENQTVSVGSDDNTDAIYWNSGYAGFYADGGSGGVGIFRQDTNWTPYGTVAFKITAND